MDIRQIISQMTLEEKASLCSGLNKWETKPVERLGVPSIWMADGPHGLRKQALDEPHPSEPATCFPAACATACSFDRSLLREMGAAIAEECVAEGVQIVLGPGANIKRSPLCGRNFEYFSEDPYLSSEMAASHINGVQSLGVGATLKHFAANNQETRRFSTDARIDERALFEIYLASFENVVRNARPATIMCSYNYLNGTCVSENGYLLTEILRDKWGFEGLVMSDWGAVNDRVKGLAAGLELEMPATDGIRDREIVAAVQAGELPMETLDLAVERILRVYERVAKQDAKPYDKNIHHALAWKIAAESAVLLKNENALPVRDSESILFVGEFAEKPRYQGAGSSQVNPHFLIPPLEAAKEFCPVKYCRGFEIDNCDEPDEALVSEAISVAKAADICVIFAGLPPAYESEGFDRDHMRLPHAQDELIHKLAAACKKTVVVLQNGSPIEMPWAGEVSAVLEAYLGGQACGGAVCDILFGKINPCGKLAESFPKKLSDNPSYPWFPGEGDTADYREGVLVGYRHYDTKEMDVLFPFGHGLSYTSFEYSNLRLDAERIKDIDILTVTADVTNTGAVAGKEIVQLYVSKKERDDLVVRPKQELRAFDKLELQPGEKKTVTFKLGKDAFAYYNSRIHDRHVISGGYVIRVARSSRDIALEGEVYVESTVSIPMRATMSTALKDLVRMKGGQEFMEKLRKTVPNIPGADTEGEPGSLDRMFARMLMDTPLRMFASFAPQTFEQLRQMIDELNAMQD